MYQVLIVDDEPALLLSIKSGFEGNDRFDVTTAGNGKEALEILENNELDLLVTDLRMPEMDGVELLATMSERFPDIPYIVMSAFGTPVIEQQLKKAGTLDFLDKPLDIEELEGAISSALEKIEDQSGMLSGITLGSFLQIFELEKKSGRLEVYSNSGKQGKLFFREGILLDCECDDLPSNDAVLEMLTWENVRIAMEKLTPPFPEPKIESDLMHLLLEAANRKDEQNAGSPLEVVKEEFVRVQEQQTDYEQTNTTGGPMAGLKGTLKEMADEMDGVLSIQVTGMDGITIAVHNPTGADVDAFSAKFAMVMKLVEKSMQALQGMGDFEENLVQSQNAWILTRFVTPQYYVGIAVSRDGTLGNVRLVAQRYLEQLRKSL